MRDNSKKNYRDYLDRKCLPQIRELMTKYGEISLVWFDTPMGTTIEESKEMIDLVKKLQPNCIVSGRVGNCLGDYMTTGDNSIPAVPFIGDWEVPATVNSTWGYDTQDDKWKDPKEIIQCLIKINSRGGNYLLNVGPDGSGRIPEKSIDILNAVGNYVNDNAEAIYATKPVVGYPYELEWGMLTCKEHKLYVHVFKNMNVFQILNVANKVTSAYLVSNGETLPYDVIKSCEGDSSVVVYLPEHLAEKDYYCVALELEEENPIFEEIRDR